MRYRKSPEKPEALAERAFNLIRRCERMGAPIAIDVIGTRLGFSRGMKSDVVNALRAANRIVVDESVRPAVLRTVKQTVSAA